MLWKNNRYLVINMLCVYTFMALFFPLMVYFVGTWGLFKYYVIPMIVFHLWLSTFLKVNETLPKIQSKQTETSLATLCSYPFWLVTFKLVGWLFGP